RTLIRVQAGSEGNGRGLTRFASRPGYRVEHAVNHYRAYLVGEQIDIGHTQIGAIGNTCVGQTTVAYRLAEHIEVARRIGGSHMVDNLKAALLAGCVQIEISCLPHGLFFRRQWESKLREIRRPLLRITKAA